MFQYATVTHPNIAFSVNKLCHLMHQSTIVHFKAMKRVHLFLRGTISRCFAITPSRTDILSAFGDVDWAWCPDDRKLTGGFLIYLGNNLIRW